MENIAMRIGDEWRAGSSTFDSIDPYTGQVWAKVANATQGDVNDAVAAARAAFDFSLSVGLQNEQGFRS